MHARSARNVRISRQAESSFFRTRGTCESVSRELRESGVGALVHHAPVISPEEEDKLWNSGAIGIYSPKALVRCVFYLICRESVCFAWRAGAKKVQQPTSAVQLGLSSTVQSQRRFHVQWP